MRGVKIHVLADNTAGPPSFAAEHGLSLLVESGERLILLDVGQGEAAVGNARRMGLDLRGVECIVLSHGHYDHTAGLPAVLEVTGPRKVICHPAAFEGKYFQLGELKRYIGMPWRREYLEAAGAVFEENDGVTDLGGGFWVTGEVPRRTAFEAGDPSLKRLVEGELAEDPLPDDQALVVDAGEGLVVVLGCAHAGVVNTAVYAREITGKDRILALVGGSHLAFLGQDQLERTIRELKLMDPALLAFSHCTGQAAARELAAAFGQRFLFNQTGMTVNVDASLLE